eukprot:scaffold1463_cov189-Ochromonas_danica.AAC.17
MLYVTVAIVFLALIAGTSQAGKVKPSPKLDTAGDPRKFHADTKLIVNKDPLPNIPKNVSVSYSSNGWVEYKQCDSRWAYQQLGWCSGVTICSAGCAMSSVAMMLATKGVDVNPGSLDEWLSNNGGYANGCDIYWGSVDAFGVTSFQGLEYASESAICNGLAQGHGIIANVNNGSHWVLLTGCQGGGVFQVNDPGYNRATYSMSEILVEAVYH